MLSMRSSKDRQKYTIGMFQCGRESLSDLWRRYECSITSVCDFFLIQNINASQYDTFFRGFTQRNSEETDPLDYITHLFCRTIFRCQSGGTKRWCKHCFNCTNDAIIFSDFATEEEVENG